MKRRADVKRSSGNVRSPHATSMHYYTLNLNFIVMNHLAVYNISASFSTGFQQWASCQPPLRHATSDFPSLTGVGHVIL